MEILKSTDDDTKLFYENYLAQRKAASNQSITLKDPEGNIVETTVPRSFTAPDVESVLKDRMPWTDSILPVLRGSLKDRTFQCIRILIQRHRLYHLLRHSQQAPKKMASTC